MEKNDRVIAFEEGTNRKLQRDVKIQLCCGSWKVVEWCGVDWSETKIAL